MQDLNKKFVIITQPRSGSTPLVEALNNHSKITCWEEMFLKDDDGKVVDRNNREKMEVLNEMFSREGYFGFKVMTVQAPVWFLEFLIATKIKVIYLERQDHFRQVISTMIANMTGKWRNAKTTQKVHIDPEVFAKGVENKLRDRVQFKTNFLNRLNHIEISYTDIVGTEGTEVKVLPEELTTKLCDFIGVDPEELKITLKKQNEGDLSQTITNWDEIQGVINDLS